MSRPDPLRQPEEAIRRLYAYAAYRLGPGADAEDVVSETIERALRYRDSYEESSGSPIAWMIGIANRCVADVLRERGRRVDVQVEDFAGVQPDFSGDVVASSEIRDAVERLEPRDRELIALRYGADLKARDIGRLLSLQTHTVEVALHRALARLRTSVDISDSRQEPARASDAVPDA